MDEVPAQNSRARILSVQLAIWKDTSESADYIERLSTFSIQN